MSGPSELDGVLRDPDHPAYGMGAAAEMLNVEPAFLRGLGTHGLLTPQRSAGGHRRYSPNDLRAAARAREMVDDGVTLAAACRIVELERELAAARQTIAELRKRLNDRVGTAPVRAQPPEGPRSA